MIQKFGSPPAEVVNFSMIAVVNFEMNIHSRPHLFETAPSHKGEVRSIIR
jgi:hypothetical protein